MMPKSHKKIGEDGLPRTRPVVAGAGGMTTRAGELICDIVDSLTKANPNPEECPSTTDCVSTMEDAEDIIQRKARFVVFGSIDADSMFTKMRMQMAAKQVAQEFIESNIKLQNIDYRKAQVYVASALSREEVVKCGLARLIPRRLSNRGTKPGVTTAEITTRRPRKELPKNQGQVGGARAGEQVSGDCPPPLTVAPSASAHGLTLPTTTPPTSTGDGECDEEEEGVETKWGPAPEITTDAGKKTVMAKVIELAIMAVMNNHYYQFGGRYLKQGTGGAIGLRLTGLVCRIVMDRWVR